MESQETKIRRGQAFNLAVAAAIADGEANNPRHIYKRYAYFYSLAEIVQGSDVEMILEVVSSKDFDDVITKLKKVFMEKK